MFDVNAFNNEILIFLLNLLNNPGIGQVQGIYFSISHSANGLGYEILVQDLHSWTRQITIISYRGDTRSKLLEVVLTSEIIGRVRRDKIREARKAAVEEALG